MEQLQTSSSLRTDLVRKGCVEFDISYNRHMERQEDIKRWIGLCRELLVAGCLIIFFFNPRFLFSLVSVLVKWFFNHLFVQVVDCMNEIVIH
jgi:hypothetical protein